MSHVSYSRRRAICFAASIAAAAPVASASAQIAIVPPHTMSPDSTRVIVLGVGSPVLSADRSGTGIAVVVRGTAYVFDAGPGVEHRLYQAGERLPIKRFGSIFITHLHSDHTLGLPALLYYAHNPGERASIIGPPGIRRMMDNILAAWSEDRDIRVNGLEKADTIRWQPKVAEVTDGIAYKDSNITVRAFEVQHGAWPHALGFRIDAPGRTIVISGDTRPSDAVVNACNGCDLLFHEIYARDNPYGASFHTTPAQLGEVAARAKPKVLVIYHAVLAGWRPEQVVAAVARNYHGAIMYAHDLDIY